MSQNNVFSKRTIRIFLWLAGGYVFLRWLLMPLLPFLLALALSATVEPWVCRFSHRWGLKRTFAAAAVTTALLAAAGTALTVLGLQMGEQLRRLSDSLPQLLESFPSLWNSILDRVERWYRLSPAFLRRLLDTTVQELTAEGTTLIGTAGTKVMGWASSAVGKLPFIGLFTITSLLAIYFTSLSYPAILSFIKRQLPKTWQGRCRKAVQCCRTTVLKWLRAELLLILITFVLLLAGLSWLKVDFALLGAVVIALIDALPVLGTGTVLVPWGVGCLLLGNSPRGIGLLALYGLVTLTHSLLEPRLLAGQGNLPPISALLAMYLGFHFMGVGGMILLPFLLLLVKRLQDAEVIRIWK